MTCALRSAVVLCLVLGAGEAFAQPPIAPAEPSTPARMQAGPLEVRPAIILRDIGWDSNVFNQAGRQEGDYTATVGAKVDASLRKSHVIGTYSSFYEYLFFKEFQSERGSNRGSEGRIDVVFGRIRPYALGGISSSHDRPNAEIDRRAGRLQTQGGFGVIAAAFSRTALNASFRRLAVEYDDDETFRGVRLADELNGHVDTISLGADIDVSPLTTVSVHGEHAAERFTLSPDRDADSYRAGVTATFNPLALISGRATLAYRAFRPLNAAVRDFSGLTAAVALAYAYRDQSRIALNFDRDLRHSFSEQMPYYISTGGRVTFTQRLAWKLDGQAVVGAERIAYEPRLDAPGVPGDHDRVRVYGGGVGYELREGARLGLNFDRTTRSSPAPDREFSRDRVYGSVTYGF
jgi:hypothetical protein